MSVRVFVEGGGNQNRTKTACRKAFRVFFDKLLGDRQKPRIVASGSRDEAYRDFTRSLSDGSTFALLLVDSEDAVPAGMKAGDHLRNRDGWTNPLPDGQVHLMVQCMEAWFLADKDALRRYLRYQDSTAPLCQGVSELKRSQKLTSFEGSKEPQQPQPKKRTTRRITASTFSRASIPVSCKNNRDSLMSCL